MGTEIQFHTASTGSSSPTQKMVLTDDGELGIGTALPSEKLHLIGNSRFDGFIGHNQAAGAFRYELTANNGDPGMRINMHSGTSGSSTAFDIRTGLVNTFRVNKDGRVSVGTSPGSSSMFLIDHNTNNGGQTNNTTLEIIGKDTGTNLGILVQDSAGGDLFAVQNDGVVIMAGLPTSSAGLPSGALWNNSNVVNII
jgi:hypothetical protein